MEWRWVWIAEFGGSLAPGCSMKYEAGDLSGLKSFSRIESAGRLPGSAAWPTLRLSDDPLDVITIVWDAQLTA